MPKSCRSQLELVAPEGGSESCPTDSLERHGPGVHHVTFGITDLDRAVVALEERTISVVDHAEFDDWEGAFLPPSNPAGARSS